MISYLSELLFVVMDGVPLFNSIWLALLWVLVCSLPIAYILSTLDIDLDRSYAKWRSLVSGCFVLVLFFVVVGVPVAQINMMTECETRQVAIDDDLAVSIKVCRALENMFEQDSWSEWKVVGQ